MSSKRIYQAFALLLTCHLVVILLSFGDYGMSWDQPVQHEYGKAVLDFYESLGRNAAARTHELRLYGGLFELLSAAVTRLTHLGWLEGRNLTSALFGLLGVWATFQLGTLAFGPMVGLISALFLTLTPVYYGHEFINPKDIPFAALYVLSLCHIVRIAIDFPELKWSHTTKTGVFLGAALGMRVAALALFPVLIGSLFCSVLWNIKSKDRRVLARYLVTAGATHVVAIIFLAWLVMLFCWPFAWKRHLTAPFFGLPFIGAPFVALKEFSSFPWNSTVFFGGHLIKWTQLPYGYLPVLLTNCLPEFILLSWLLGLVSGLRAVLSRRVVLDRHSLAVSIILAAAAGPLMVIVLKHVPLYDNFRHVLFTIPPLIILAAFGLCTFLEVVRNRTVQTVTLGLYLFLVLVTIMDMRALHPYEYIYFNRLVAGGLAQANRQFELEYWGTAFREAAIWVREYYRPSGVSEIIYSSNALPELTDYFMLAPPQPAVRLRRAIAGEAPRIYLSLRRQRQQTEPDWGHTLHTISRSGVVLLDIVEL